ncbi:MAG: alpha/beta hydrolase [Myxococcota bacterium]|nr:alpha/beta hydrolase [Myxococcota bacterium]
MQPLEVARLAGLMAGSAGAVVARRLTQGPRRPGWSLRAELGIGALRALMMASKQRDVPWLRAAQGALPLRSPLLKQVRFEPEDAGGVPAQWCTPLTGPEPSRTVVYLHGGGYVIGEVDGFRDLLARLALGAEARVLGVDYRLAPEHPFPAPQDDCLAAARWVLEQGTDPARLAVAGDSAGGALAVATLVSLRDAGDPLPAAGVLLCPWTDPWAAGGSLEHNADCDFGDRELLDSWLELLMGPSPARDPRVAVADAKLDGLPPLLVQAGGAEILLDQIQLFATRALDAGVDVTFEVHGEMFHDFQLMAMMLPEGAAAVGEITAFLRQRLST